MKHVGVLCRFHEALNIIMKILYVILYKIRVCIEAEFTSLIIHKAGYCPEWLAEEVK